MTLRAAMPPSDPRRALGAFLRARREALSPADAGMYPMPGRRRTPGLRREEAAQLCGISTTWYTWLEQGRPVACSAATLARLAEALRLSRAERAYLFELARQTDPRPPDAGAAPCVPPELLALPGLVLVPAYLLDRSWSVRAANDAARRLFAAWIGGAEPNLLRYVFLDPGARGFLDDWEESARRILAEFRAETARLSEDASIVAMLDRLHAESPDFARLWRGHAVLPRAGGRRRFHHPLDGTVSYAQATLVPAGHPDHKLVILTPVTE
ncbi:helix-turn-helix transcriptional regulator [Nguyenibacter sp. L1]|uniref:helix-turn-helix transcriptional regulator n=1 Tax=Nguyenibacter sp. L1 TaxID=3049350 RepID=UPI002B46DFBB|nr:helix-turn-helix transcriptional regulator [Nguyenibacter sp. L1]WRH87062.1 helix-turn-helix transcriptional regulator [Nguyenibacter sp. L1]